MYFCPHGNSGRGPSVHFLLGLLRLYLRDFHDPLNLCVRHLRQTLGHAHIQIHLIILKQMYKKSNTNIKIVIF